MKSLLTLLAVAGIGIAPITTQAEAVEYPAGNPLFKMELPEGWTSSSDKAGNLDVKANDKGDFDFSIIPATVGTEDELKTSLPDLAKSMGKDMKEFTVNPVKDVTLESGMKMSVLSARGKLEDQEMVITLAAFAPAKKKFFVIMSIAEKSVDAAHDKVMGQIVETIKPIK